MTGEQWSRAFTLFKSLSTLPPKEAIGLLEQSGQDPEILDEVRQILSGSNPDTLWRTGITLGRYVVGEPLGRGGYGEVYRGQDTVLGRAVALKFLLSKARPAKPASRRLLEEAQAASALNHPNIVTVTR
jgi:eukaryotic-like serine/threonine-protein kinase